MSDKLKQFHAILEDMFQLNQADLDFGIYRIMNQKRQEINRFLNDDLVPQVEAAFAQAGGDKKALLERELEKLVDSLRDAGATPDMITQMPKIKELQERLSATEQGAGALADEVFSHLTNFFRRYYKEGDFISLPRYKDGVYAIPYNGEEIKLHWANADQYYIKTTEYFRDYVFRLENGKAVHFKIVDASTEQDNNKAEKDKERRFILSQEDTVSVENDELVIRFVYQAMKEKQNKLNLTTIKILQKILGEAQLADFSGVWQIVPTEKDPKRTLLEKHLNDYTAKNSFDYFIHKNLGGFLRRELDFYIKNEVMYLDDLDTENEVKAHQYLNKVKVIKSLGNKIIAFLAQLEDFQKKLWLKKKFVVETNYCLTLDRVPEEFYEEIIANKAQLEEWKRLFAIEEVKGYVEPLTVEFLQSNPFLVLDTASFSREFKERLLASMDDIDGKMDGLLIHSENFQALSFLYARYKGKIDCIYADPPYNAKSSEILYKNAYKHSSWISFMHDRIMLSSKFKTKEASLITAIDENEVSNLLQLIHGCLPNWTKSCISIIHNPAGVQGDNFSYSHEYAIFAFENIKNIIGKTDRDKESEEAFRDWGGTSARTLAKNCFYPIYVKDNNIVGFGDVCSDDYHPGDSNIINGAIVEIYPVSEDGVERKWVFARDTVEDILDELSVSERNGILSIRRTKTKTRYKTVWQDTKYYANIYGSKLLNNIMGNKVFDFPKSLYTVQDCLWAVNSVRNKDATVLDYFAGSGTTAHAVINLNRKDKGSRKYILVEMGEYFDSVTKPRVQKVIYSKDWKDGKPVSREGSSHMFKYMRLESFEDTLNNLELRRTDAQQIQLELHDKVREEYLLSYMLELESQDSPSLLNLDAFRNPFDYTLNITRRNESRPVVVDLPETFNYLLGLTVRQSEVVRDFKVIRGELPSGERALIIWRNLNEKSNQDLEDFLDRSGYNPRDNEFDRIYVNGDNYIENRRTEGERWKVLLIEEEFKRLMFDLRDL